MGKMILILGGARSGKSTFAEKLAAEIGDASVLYVATAEAKDDEMRDRIIKHQSERPSTWDTLELPTDVGNGIKKVWDGQSAILIDCFTLLVSNILLENSSDADVSIAANYVQEKVLNELETLLESVKDLKTTTIMVSNEVGLGLVPPYELGRVYRDVLGRANQYMANNVDEVLFMVAGLPMRVK